jgi:hypothetical protein
VQRLRRLNAQNKRSPPNLALTTHTRTTFTPNGRSDLTQPRSENFGIFQQEQLKSTTFCSAARNTLEFTNKSNRINCILFCRAKTLGLRGEALYFIQQRNFLELRRKALYFVLPRSENFGISQQKQLKLTAFCSAVQRKIKELRPKALYFVENFQTTAYFVQSRRKTLELRSKALYFAQPYSENFGIVNKSTVFGSAAQRKLWNCEQNCTLFSRAPKKL